MKVFSIVVSYNPDPEGLLALCRPLVQCSHAVLIVDNSDGGSNAGTVELPGCTVIPMGENKGIAYAQNVGIKVATESGADVIAFFDQDSRPDLDLLQRLLASLKVDKPGVVSPVCIDSRNGTELPSFRVNRMGLLRKIYSDGRTKPYDVDMVISSGSVATTATFALAGGMDESLFIDFVDFEWCLRCRRNNISIRVDPRVQIPHSIGQKSVDLGLFGGVIHSHTRSYYKIRNCFLLFRKSDVPLLLALRETVGALLQYICILPLVKNRLSYARVFFEAIYDGIRGVVGRNPRQL